ncbi:MAG TPA: hypothetical protein VKU82_07440, partial [Planctomycetaceae bacterium]|nr:hypothetical protein [Planctomycetaceae bacterium]
EAVENRAWGISIDSVTIAGVVPPVEVKAAFLDVSNARAERDRLINQEQSRGEKLLAATRGAVQQTIDRAEARRLAQIESAKGAADRFLRVIAQIRREADSNGRSHEDVRRATMRRQFAAALEELLPKLSGQVLLDATKPVDLTIFPAQDQPAGSSQKSNR